MARKILGFFHQHPHAVETERGLSSWVGEEGQRIKEALKELAFRKWLLVDETSRMAGYALTRDERMLEQIQTVLKGID